MRSRFKVDIWLKDLNVYINSSSIMAEAADYRVWPSHMTPDRTNLNEGVIRLEFHF
jgi:hypothetical protein